MSTGSTSRGKVDWEYRYVEEHEVFPTEVSGSPWLDHAAWADWNEVYRTTYREYIANQRAKDDGVMGVRSVLTKAHVRQELDLGWLQLVKFHNALFALSEYAAAVGELRMARFGRDSAWRTMATLGALDEIRHAQIPLLLGHDLLPLDGNFDWTHRAYHTTEWVMIAARHLFDDMILAADAIEVAVQLNFVFETGFTNLQFMAMSAMADGVHDHLFEKALLSIQTDEARHAQIGHPVLRTLIENGEAQRAQYLVDKMWWRSWRVLIALTGTSMEYLTPVRARAKSFRQFMEEWIIDQFMKNLAEFGLERPWFWELFLEELDYCPPQPAARPLRLPPHPLVRRRHARRGRTGVAGERLSALGGDVRLPLGRGRPKLEDERRTRDSRLCVASFVQSVSAADGVREARPEHCLHRDE